MKSRRLVLTIEVDTDLTIAEISKADRIAIGMDSHMGAVWIYREPGPGSGRLVQVQVNAIQPVRKPYKLPKAKRAKGAK